MANYNNATYDQSMISRADEARHSEYGGFHFGSAFFGWLVANSVGVLLVSLLAAAGSAVAISTTTDASQLTNQAATVGIVSGVLLTVALAVAYFAGGYVAGRLSRFDGARQGIGVWGIGVAITVLLALIGAALGANFNLLQQLSLPTIPVDGSSLTTGGLLTLLAVAVVTLLAAIGGGKAGERFHHKVDSVGIDDGDHRMDDHRSE